MKKVIATLIGLLACFAFGYFWKDIRNNQFPGSSRDYLLGIRTSGKNVRDDQVFKDVYARVAGTNIKKADRKELKYAAMEGLVASLGDPHSNFFVPKINTAFRDETSGKFFGIGARLTPDNAGVKVTQVFTDGPAQKADVLAGDIITTVDGTNVAGMDSDDIVLMIKGKENTIVRLKILRPNVEQPIEFAIKRQKVVPPSVESKVLKAQNTGYIRILNFSQEVPEQFDRELETVEAAGIKGLVIDLRGNPGGSLDAAIMILSRFIDNKLAVTLKFREENQQETYETSKGDTHNFKYPITVLVDGESASAAEIMAGVLKDYNKATLIGERTYGKFSVQTVFNQIDGAGIKLTIAHYFLPKSGAKSRKVDEDGTYISGGLDPDILVKVDEEKEYEPGNLERDNQLARAVEFIRTGK